MFKDKGFFWILGAFLIFCDLFVFVSENISILFCVVFINVVLIKVSDI